MSIRCRSIETRERKNEGKKDIRKRQYFLELLMGKRTRSVTEDSIVDGERKCGNTRGVPGRYSQSKRGPGGQRNISNYREKESKRNRYLTLCELLQDL